MNRHMHKLDRKTLALRIQACLLAGTFSDLREFGVAAAELTLFTVEGLLRAYQRSIQRGICHVESVVDYALIRWLALCGQSNRLSERALSHPSLMYSTLQRIWNPQKQCHSDVLSCLSAIQQKQSLGVSATNTRESMLVINSMAAVAAMGATLTMPESWVFEQAADIVALTHSLPETKLKGGFAAVLLNQLFIHGTENIQAAIEIAKNTAHDSGLGMKQLTFDDVVQHLSPQFKAMQKVDSGDFSLNEFAPCELKTFTIDIANDLCEFSGWPGEYDPEAPPECRSHLYPPV